MRLQFSKKVDHSYDDIIDALYMDAKRLNKHIDLLSQTKSDLLTTISLPELTHEHTDDFFKKIYEGVGNKIKKTKSNGNFESRLSLIRDLYLAEVRKSAFGDRAKFLWKQDQQTGESYAMLRSGNDGEENHLINLHGLVGNPANFYAQHNEGALAHYTMSSPILHNTLHGKDKEAHIPGVVAYLKRCLDSVGIERAYLHGCSLGAEFAYKFALSYPERVKGLILSGASGLQENEHFENRIRVLETMIKFGMYGRMKGMIKQQFHDTTKVPLGLEAEIFNFVWQPTIRAWAKSLAHDTNAAEIEKNKELIHTLNKFAIPTLYLFGKHDRITPPSIAEKFHDLTPHSDLHFFNAGHTPNMECSNEYNQVLTNRLKAHDNA